MAGTGENIKTGPKSDAFSQNPLRSPGKEKSESEI